MAGERKRETYCPSCQAKVGVPVWHTGKVRCPSCSFVWHPSDELGPTGMIYVQKPKRNFAMNLGDTIEYGMSMIPIVVMTILISAIIAWGGFEILAMSPEANEPIVAICFGISLFALSLIVFVSMIFGIGVRVVAEGVLVGNIATENYQNKENSLTISNHMPDLKNEQLSISHPENATDSAQDDSVNQLGPE